MLMKSNPYFYLRDFLKYKFMALGFSRYYKFKRFIHIIKNLIRFRYEPYCGRPPLDFYFAKQFISYIYSQNFDEYYKNLIKGLDKESKKTIDAFLLKVKYILHHNWFEFEEIHDKYNVKDINQGLKELFYMYKKYYFPFRQDLFLFFNKYGLKYIPKKILNRIKGKVILDCGAYIGDSSIIFYEYIGGKVYAFEPEPNNYKILYKVIQKNGLNEKIIPIKCGVSDRDTIYKLQSEGGGSRISEDGKYKIKVIKIDDFIKENNISNVGLIKMDIEGHEFEAIQGALETIRKYKPVLLISIYHRGKDFFEIKPMLEKFGYKFKVAKLVPYFARDVVLIGYV